MVTIELEFPAHRYHANPWGRNVNEGVVEWPPSPFRLARALIDVYYRRRPDWSLDRLSGVLGILAGQPSVMLPPAAASHVRSYLSSNQEDVTGKQKIFDAFVVLNKNSLVRLGFPGDYDPKTIKDMHELLGELNYFGRSESWVRAGVGPEMDPGLANCRPLSIDDQAPGFEAVQVACLRSKDDYMGLRRRPKKKKGGKAELSWVEAVGMSSSQLLKDGWSHPPGQEMVDYILPPGALKAGLHQPTVKKRAGFNRARYALYSTVLPRTTQTMPLAERIRTKLMGIHKIIMDKDPAKVSPVFSGKDSQGRRAQGHGHAFFLPLDEDHDGRIDHFVIQAAQPFKPDELKALDLLRRTWQPKGRPDIEFVLVGLSAENQAKATRSFVSASPFITVRHHRKGRGLFQDWLVGELERECANHGLPRPEKVEFTRWTTNSAPRIRWPEFVRSRKGGRPHPGHGFRITFPTPVKGPFTLGALCHFGLGLFVSDGDES